MRRGQRTAWNPHRPVCERRGEWRAASPILAALARSTAAVGHTGSSMILQHLAPSQGVAEGGLANTSLCVNLDFPPVAPIRLCQVTIVATIVLARA